MVNVRCSKNKIKKEIGPIPQARKVIASSKLKLDEARSNVYKQIIMSEE